MELNNRKTNDCQGAGDEPLITLRKVGKSYVTPAGPYPALRDIDLEIDAGEFVALVGKSGSGKTTLLNLIGGIDRPSEGEVIVAGVAAHQVPENSLARWRGKTVGVVFQFFQLLPTLTVAENVMLPMDFCNVRPLSSSSKADLRFSADQHMVMIYIFLIVVSGILAGVGGLGLMTTMSLNVLERRREMGVLRAIGATPSVVWLIVIIEGVVIGVLSWALGTVAAWPVSRAVGDLLVKAMFKVGLDFFFEPSGPLVWLGVSICLGAVASFLPAWHATRRPVREAIGYE